MKRTSLLLSFAFLVFVLAVACSRKPDDARISSDIQAKYSQDSGLSSKQLSVQSENGTVTINGTVDNTQQRDAASRQAASEPGVKQVVNNLILANSPMTAESQPAAAPASTIPVSKPNPGKTARPQKKKSGAEERSAATETDSASDDQPAAETQPASPPPDATTAAPPPPPTPPAPKQFIIDQGTTMAVRLIEPLDTEKNQVGDTFHATLNTPLSSDGEEAVPAGVEVTGHVVDVKSASKFAGQSVLVLQLDVLASAGKNYNLQTDQYRKEGKARGKNTAEKVGGGAVLGGIIGALAGGGKGAAIGAAAGAGAGGAVQAASKSQAIKLPAETVLNFTLQQPVTVLKPPPSDANREKLKDSQQN